MRKIILTLGLLLCVPLLAHAEGKFVVNGTNGGQFTDLAVLGANTSTTKKSGLKATIDLSSIAQTSSIATTTPVLALSQTAISGPVFGITCTNGGGSANSPAFNNTCSTYTSTTSTKVGAIKIFINGQDRYINLQNTPA